MITPSPLIDISGPPLVRGQQYGEQARERIHRGANHYIEQLRRAHFDWPDVRVAVDDYLPLITQFDAAYVDEMRGIAAGANIEFAAIVLLNARTEILQIARRRAQIDDTHDDDPDGCTGVIALPSACANRRLLHAQNWDWKAECAETTVVLRVKGTDAPDLLTFTEAGALARCGFNSVGIGITANYLECERDYSQVGVPLALIRRKVLEQKHFALAIRAVQATQKSASNNIMLSHAQGVGLDFECAPNEAFIVQEQDGLLVHANHWQSPIALGRLTDTGIASTPDSLYRDIRVRELLSPHIGQLTLSHLKGALFDDFASPWSVCRPPRTTNASNLSATVAMIAMDPAQGLMEVAMLPGLNRKFEAYRLATTFAPTRTPVPWGGQ